MSLNHYKELVDLTSYNRTWMNSCLVWVTLSGSWMSLTREWISNEPVIVMPNSKRVFRSSMLIISCLRVSSLALVFISFQVLFVTSSDNFQVLFSSPYELNANLHSLSEKTFIPDTYRAILDSMRLVIKSTDKLSRLAGEYSTPFSSDDALAKITLPLFPNSGCWYSTK